MKESDQIDKIARYLSGNLPENEQEDLLRWANESAENRSLWEDAQQLWKLSEQYEAPQHEANVTMGWEKVESRLDLPAEEAPRPVRRIPIYRHLGRIAAVLLVAALAAWWLWNPQPDPRITPMTLVQTKTGEVRELLLPDGSQIWLNENSELRYDQEFTERQVNLVGEAYFDIARMEEKPFEIISGEAKTVVLGTAFNVRAYPTEDKVEVTVVRGKVALVEAEKPQEAIVLDAGKTGNYDKVEKNVTRVEAPKVNADSWKTKMLVYKDTPLSEVIESLERYFDVKIEAANPKLLNCRLEGSYHQPQLDDMLQIITATINSELNQQGNRYLLEGEGCD